MCGTPRAKPGYFLSPPELAGAGAGDVAAPEDADDPDDADPPSVEEAPELLPPPESLASFAAPLDFELLYRSACQPPPLKLTAGA